MGKTFLPLKMKLVIMKAKLHQPRQNWKITKYRWVFVAIWSLHAKLQLIWITHLARATVVALNLSKHLMIGGIRADAEFFFKNISKHIAILYFIAGKKTKKSVCNHNKTDTIITNYKAKYAIVKSTMKRHRPGEYIAWIGEPCIRESSCRCFASSVILIMAYDVYYR